MFTGLVHGQAHISQITKKQHTIKLTIASSPSFFAGLAIGDSIAVDGCCLTVVNFDQQHFTVDMMPQSYQKTIFKNRQLGDQVNIERALQVGQRLDGHLVTGHIDNTTKVLARRENENAIELIFALPPQLRGQVISQGSVAINGASLTVMQADTEKFSVGLIPHTQEETNLSLLKVGSEVNLETDLLGKYVRNNLAKFKGEK